MSQLVYNTQFRTGQPGSLADSGQHDALTYLATENVPFGRGLIQGSTPNTARMPSSNVATVELSVPLVASNLVTMNVNGTIITYTALGSGSNVELPGIATLISAVDGVTAAYTSGNQFTVTSSIGAIAFNIEITGGASQPTATVTLTSSGGNFVGVSLGTNTIAQTLDGEAFYKPTEAISVLIKGRLFVEVFNDVTTASPVSVRIQPVIGGEVGIFGTGTAGGTARYLSGSRFLSNTAAGEVAILDLNIPVSNANTLLLSVPTP